MNKHFIISRLQKKFRKGVILYLIILIIACAVSTYVLWNRMGEIAFKPITAAGQLEEIEAADDLTEVTVTDLFYAGYYVGEDEANVDAYDFFATIEETGENVVVSLKADNISEADLENPPATYQIKYGWVVEDQEFNAMITTDRFEGDSEEFNTYFTGYIVVEANIQDMIRDYELETALIIIGIGLAVVLFLLITKIVNLCNPRGSRQFRELKKLSGDLEQNLTSIDREMGDGRARQVDDVLISRNWVVTEKMFVYKTEDIIWVYIVETKHYRNGIPTGTSFKGFIGLKNGALVEAYETYDASVSPAFMETMNESAPYAVYGFSEEIKRMFNKDRSQLVAAVEENRRNMMMSDGL